MDVLLKCRMPFLLCLNTLTLLYVSYNDFFPNARKVSMTHAR